MRQDGFPMSWLGGLEIRQMYAETKREFFLRAHSPDFQDLPWEYSLSEWPDHCSRLEEAPRGLSRHPVVFVNYGGILYSLKELPASIAQKEYDNLLKLEDLRLPAVSPIGYLHLTRWVPAETKVGILITRYLDFSLPYRSLFIQSTLDRYREHLLDAMAGLLVQLHLAGVFWGDCSLSNTLFRRDAGALGAYLVDAETIESHNTRLEPTLRHHDLEIMQENIDGEIGDLLVSGLLSFEPKFQLMQTGTYIRQAYKRLWEEITREPVINQDERYRIHERIRALNELGFSVGSVDMIPLVDQDGEKLKLRFIVTDRNFHQNQLHSLTGLEVEEQQAILIMNEIQELKATMSLGKNRSTPLTAAAFHWIEMYYQPVLERLQAYFDQADKPDMDPVELYCQMLEHKWYLSERAQRDVGHLTAVDDYLKHVLSKQ
jgi:hypothetical protein